MSNDTLNCPYCNAVIPAPAGTVSGRRITCPRCGDPFTVRPLDSAVVAQPVVSITEAPAPPRRPRSNRMVAAVVLGVMVLMAGGGLTLALVTQKDRRAHDTGLSRRPRRSPLASDTEETPPAPLPPDKLPALGYLPPGTNLILGARVTELLASKAGSQLLKDPVQVGGSEYRLSTLPAWVGLRLEDIDHLALGVRLDDALLPPFYLVVRTRQPCDAEQVRRALKATRVAAPGDKTLYSFRTAQGDLPLTLWFADDQTLVVALLPDQFAAVPARPEEDLGQLPAELRTVLRERREPVAPAWLAGHSRDWTKTWAAKLLDRLKKEDRERLRRVQTFGVWLQPNGTLTLMAVCGCKDEEAARSLDAFLHAPRGDADRTLKTALDGPWLNLQWQIEPDRVARLLKR
jgi:hypothetical protein